jgi:dCTP deaminase
MILSDLEIERRLLSKHLGISNFRKEHLNPCSYDVTLNPEIAFYQDKTFDCKKEHLLAEPIILTDEGYELQPGVLYLGHCNEYLKIPYNLKSTLSGKSSLGRLGLMIHLTAGFIDPGFEGSLVLELACIQPIKIYPNMLIGQIEFEEVSGNIKNDYSLKSKSKYNKQKGNQSSKYYLNFYGH